MRRTIAIICLVLIVLPGSAHARTQTVLDPDDTDGPLDTVAARHRPYKLWVGTSHGEFTVPVIRLRLVTYEKWLPELLADDRNFISFEFNRDADANIERCLVVKGSGSGLTSQLFKNCLYMNDQPVTDSQEAFRAGGDEHVVEVDMGRRQIAGKKSRYWWRSVTSFETPEQNSACPAPTPLADGGYATCTDATRWTKHSF